MITKEELKYIAQLFSDYMIKEINNDPGYKKSLGDTDPIPEEIGDLLTLIFAFCNKTGINPEEWVNNTIRKESKQG